MKTPSLLSFAILTAFTSTLFAADAPAGSVQPERFGCVFGSDYMLTLPDDFTASVAKCRRSHKPSKGSGSVC